MNTYDFDKTIFYPDSSYWFTRWCLNRHPLLYLRWIPEIVIIGLLYILKLVSKERFKEAIFCYIPYLRDIDRELELFWNKSEHRISPWYLKQKRPDDLVISASPDFLVRPMTERLGISLIASGMDKHTGKAEGLTCWGKEKVRRFFEEYPNAKTEAFYSDSFKDTPMAELADKAYLITNKGKTPVPWPNKKTHR